MPAEEPASTSAKEEEVTEEEIRLFKTTLLARRFPGVKAMRDEAIKELLLADRKATGRKLQAHRKSYPKSDFKPAPPKREAQEEKVSPWAPVSPAGAKATVTRPHNEAFISTGSPYYADYEDYMQDKTADMAKCPMPFLPTSAAEAKATIRVDYYLNSADHATRAADLEGTRSRGREHMEAYRDAYETRRGRTLVDSGSGQRRPSDDDV